MSNPSRWIAATLLAVNLAAPGARAQVSNAPERADPSTPGTFTLGPTLDYSSGKFGGTESTDIWSVGVTGRYERGPWVVRATVPYVDVSGPGNVVPAGGGGGVPVCRQAGTGTGAGTGLSCAGGVTSTTPASRFHEAGLGDITLGVGVTLLDRSSTTFGLTAKAKLPTADEAKGLGTGEYDISAQGDLYQAIGSASAFASAGYRWYGDPAGFDLKDGAFGAIGATYPVTAQTTFGIAYDYRQPSYDGGASLNEVSLLASYRVSTSARVRGYVFKGLTDGGPDWGAGVAALFSF